MAPEWWEVAVGDGALLPVREGIDAHEAYAMRIYPAKHELPGLALATFHLLDNVGSGPDVAKALASIHRLTLCVCLCLWIPSGIDVTRVCGHA